MATGLEKQKQAIVWRREFGPENQTFVKIAQALILSGLYNPDTLLSHFEGLVRDGQKRQKWEHLEMEMALRYPDIYLSYFDELPSNLHLEANPYDD